MMITTREEYYGALAIISNEDIVVIDTETHRVETWDERKLLGIAVWAPKAGEGYYFSVSHREHMQAKNFPVEPILEALQDVPNWVMHNRKFDDQVLRYAGIARLSYTYDTMLMAWLLDEHPPHDLDALALRHLGPESHKWSGELKKLMKEQKMTWEEIPSDIMGLYAIRDAKLEWELYEHLRPQFDEQLQEVLERELAFQKALTDLEFDGVSFDRALALQFAVQAQQRIDQILDELKFDPSKPSQLARKLFDQLHLIPVSYSGTPTKSFPNGRPLTAKVALATYRGKSPEVDRVVNLVLEYRTLVKAKSTWYEGWANLGPTGILHPSYSQHSDGIERKDEKFGTVTGRVTCSKPNMQQVPREGPVKGLLRARAGMDLLEFDYSQVEFRLAAVYAEDEEVLNKLRAGQDFHQLVADALSIERQHAKTINFAVLYGGKEPTLMRNLNITYGEATRLLNYFDEMLPAFAQIKERVTWAMKDKGWIRMWSGRRCHLKEAYKAKDAFNKLIQGGAADIMKETMIRLSNSGLPIMMVGQVHDSLWIEVPADNLPLHTSIREIMEWPESEFGIPFPVDMKILYKGEKLDHHSREAA